MNQILFFKKEDTKKENIQVIEKKLLFKKNYFKFQFISCCLISIIIFIYYIYYLYNNNKKEELSKKLIDDFSITTLYATNNYNNIQTSNINYYETESNSFTVIGLIEINSININYPILSTVNYELLKIAPCRFYGPLPNEIGNLCIAAHNYNNYKFFSRLKNLKIGDTINIYDLSRKKNTILRLSYL